MDDAIYKVVNQQIISKGCFYTSGCHKDTLLIWFFFVNRVIGQSARNVHQRKNNFVDGAFFVVAHLIDQAAMTTTTTLGVKGADNVKLRTIAKLQGNIIFTKITRGVTNFATNDFLTKQRPAIIDFHNLFFCNLRGLSFIGCANESFCAGDKYALQNHCKNGNKGF